MADWEVQRSSGKCIVSGRELSAGEEFYTVLFERGETLERVDYALDAWTGPPDGAFCFWKSRVPVREKKQQIWVDNDVLMNLFQRLAGESDESKVRFRFVLALLLMRKKLLKYEQSVREGEREMWQMRQTGTSAEGPGAVHAVENPRLSDDQVASLSEQLTSILHGDVRDEVLARAMTEDATDAPDAGSDAAAGGGASGAS